MHNIGDQFLIGRTGFARLTLNALIGRQNTARRLHRRAFATNPYSRQSPLTQPFIFATRNLPLMPADRRSS
jgi:hypothetical protein